MKGDSFFQRLWYQRKSRWLMVLLLPLSALFWLVSSLRRVGYRVGLLRSHRVQRPVIVVGNITVGGTGKTPFVMLLTSMLQSKGYRVGVVLRGYGGSSAHWPRDVEPSSPTAEVGDEAVLHAARTGALVVAGPDRVAAAERAIERGADIVICDDGLQHYRLARNAEIAVLDSDRQLGNRCLLPAGPLREPASRLNAVDLIVHTRRSPTSATTGSVVTTTAQLGDAINLLTGEHRQLSAFGGTRVHAVAGIGNPEAFFAGLRGAGLQVDARGLPDHAAITPADISFSGDAPVLMTEKDAVKCRGFADIRHWAVRLETTLSDVDAQRVNDLLDRVVGASSGKR